MKRHLVTVLCLCVAIALYAVGLAAPAAGLIVLGLVFELVFWWRVLRRHRTGSD